MMAVQDRIKAIAELVKKVETHPLCLRLENHTYYYLVILPDGYSYDAVRVHTGEGKAKALKVLWSKLEEVWERSSLFTRC